MTLDEYFQHFGSGFSGGPLLAIPVALLGGVVAGAVCPCTLPVGFGVAGAAGASEAQSRRSGFMIATAFFAGILVNLTILGALASQLGGILTESFGRYWTLAMALISLLAAILAFWGPRLKSYQLAALRKPGMAGAFLYGFIFSLGTSAAPLLLLLTVAASYAGTAYGVVLSFAFGLGRGLPFLLVGVFAGAITRLARVAFWRRAIQFLSGSALLFLSIYYIRSFMDLL